MVVRGGGGGGGGMGAGGGGYGNFWRNLMNLSSVRGGFRRGSVKLPLTQHFIFYGKF